MKGLPCRAEGDRGQARVVDAEPSASELSDSSWRKASSRDGTPVGTRQDCKSPHRQLGKVHLISVCCVCTAPQEMLCVRTCLVLLKCLSEDIWQNQTS